MMHFFDIEGAVLAPDLRLLHFINVKLPDESKEYKKGMQDGKYTWASKDGKRYYLALGVRVKGHMYSAEEIYESSKKTFIDL